MEAPSISDFSTEKIVNVASVPQLSPFRYPGGKTWLVPSIRRILTSFRSQPQKFIDPFAGGGIVPLTVAFEDLAAYVVMGELDANVSAVWKTILAPGGAKWLANRILEFPLSRETVVDALSFKSKSLRQVAFQTILRNRVQRGGIMAPGAGLVKFGENGRGLASRWYPETLARRVLEISELRTKIRFVQGDGFELIYKYKNNPEVVFFIDPPYTAGGKRAGTRLYIHNELNHAKLFQLISESRGAAILTYDDSDEINELARTYRFDINLVMMKSTHHAKMTELVIVKRKESSA